VLVVTHSELRATPLKEIWQSLRALRSQEIGRTTEAGRRATFDAALEQAEQLFTAAASIGTAAQPIPLFYGLCQLGRSIAAASPRVANSEYRLVGHGIKDKALEDSARQGLAQIEIRGEKRGAFPMVARALGSAPMTEDVTLGDLWDLLPYTDRFPLPQRGKLKRLILDSELPHILRGPDTVRGRLYPLPVGLQSSVKDPTVSRDVVGDALIAQERELLAQFLADYPTLSGCRSTNTDGQPIPYERGFNSSEEYLVLPLVLPKSEGVAESSELEGRSVDYHGVHYVYPRLDSSDLPAHPFMIWWAVLFVLSRLARYQPNEWLDLTSVSRSTHAVAIEHILSEALRAVPELALTAIARCA
jgi:hypothetical protein